MLSGHNVVPSCKPPRDLNDKQFEMNRRGLLGNVSLAGLTLLGVSMNVNANANSSKLDKSYPSIALERFANTLQKKLVFDTPYADLPKDLEQGIIAINSARQRIKEILPPTTNFLESVVDKSILEQREQVRRECWSNLMDIGRFRARLPTSASEDYDSDSFDRFMIESYPELLARFGILALPYPQVAGWADSEKLALVDYGFDYFTLGNREVRALRNFSDSYEDLAVVSITGELTIADKSINGLPHRYNGVTVFDTIFINESVIEDKYKSLRKSLNDGFLEVRNYLAARGVVEDTSMDQVVPALFDFVSAMPKETKARWAHQCAIFIVRSHIARRGFVLSDIRDTTIEHEAGHVFAMREKLRFNGYNLDPDCSLSDAWSELLNRDSHSETCGYFRQLLNGRGDLTLYDLLFIVENSADLKLQQSTGHFLAARTILDALGQGLIQNAANWNLPISSARTGISVDNQARMLLAHYIGTNPDSLDDVVAVLEAKHRSEHLANWGTSIVAEFGRKLSTPTVMAKNYSKGEGRPCSNWLPWLGGVGFSIAAVIALRNRTRSSKS